MLSMPRLPMCGGRGTGSAVVSGEKIRGTSMGGDESVGEASRGEQARVSSVGGADPEPTDWNCVNVKLNKF